MLAGRGFVQPPLSDQVYGFAAFHQLHCLVRCLQVSSFCVFISPRIFFAMGTTVPADSHLRLLNMICTIMAVCRMRLIALITLDKAFNAQQI